MIFVQATSILVRKAVAVLGRWRLRAAASEWAAHVFCLVLFAAFAATAAAAGKTPRIPARTGLAPALDIVRDPSDIPPPVGIRPPTVVRVSLTAKELVGKLDPASNTTYRYWTFNGKVPGPMIRVRQGDRVEVTLRNDPSSQMVHSVDFHAALGTRGGAAISQTLPGESNVFTFQATTPGLYVYHCGTPFVAQHIANGMYGLILVEPPGGLPHVDHEYYVMQGEIYSSEPKGKAGLQQFSNAKLMQEAPEYFLFNGAVDALTKEFPLKAKEGEAVRIFFGDAGPNKPSSLHILGEIFGQDDRAGSLTSPPLTNVQTALVAPGSAAILEFKARDSGEFTMVDHAMARMAKGAEATIEVSGTPNAVLMHNGPAAPTSGQTISGMTESDMAAALTKVPAQASQTAEANSKSSKESASTTGRSPAEVQNAAAPAQQTNTAASATSPTELNGCLKIQSDGEAILHVLDSQKEYRVEARPLLFAQNDNRIVHLTGYFGSVLSEEDPNIPSFVVNTVEPLAPNCTTKVTPAMIREASDQEQKAVPKGPTVQVGMTDLRFTPPTVTIKAGQQVVWKNTSRVIHDVADDAMKALNPQDVHLPAGAKSFSSGFLQPGQSYSKVFTKPGTYRYVCTLHEGNDMKGTVVVQ